MSFQPPNFNLICAIWSGPWLSKVLRNSAVPCNLALGRRVNSPQSGFNPVLSGSAQPTLLVPARTDIRDVSCGVPSDLVECPVGSGRWYVVNIVDDVGKGFSNEYRVVAMIKACQFVDGVEFAGLDWPIPIP
jgi:hypothetical protein